MSDSWMVYTFTNGELEEVSDRTRSAMAVLDRRTNLRGPDGLYWSLLVSTERLVVRELPGRYLQFYVHRDLVDESPGRNGTP